MIFYDITFKASQNLTDNAFIGKLINKETSNEHNSKSLLYKINELLDKEFTNKNFMVQSNKLTLIMVWSLVAKATKNMVCIFSFSL